MSLSAVLDYPQRSEEKTNPSPAANWQQLISNREFVAINIGCGNVRLPQFINIDIEKTAATDYCADLNQGLSFIPTESVDIIYSEHLWEHLTREQGLRLGQECVRILKKGGRMRIATPDLDYVIYKYTFDWKSQKWLDTPPWNETVRTRGEMLNMAMREWGHLFVYNEEDLTRSLREIGFEEIYRCQPGASADKRLWNLETRADSTLILEGIKL